MSRMIQRFWVEDSGCSDLDSGMIEWSDGEQEYAIDVHKINSDDEVGLVITQKEHDWLVWKVSQLAVGLTSYEQLYFLYDGALRSAVDSDVSELEPVPVSR